MSASLCIVLGFALGTAFGAIGCWAAYRNGVTDGFGFAWEPKNSGYRKAGLYLWKHMAYRWPHIKNPDYAEALKLRG